jgi:zinc transport system substrate-binding protein
MELSMRKITLAMIALSIIGIGGCQNPAPPKEVRENTADKLAVTVSILPQQYFVERIGGDRIAVNVMVLPGANHELYEPKPEQLRSLAKSKVYFTIGELPFEKTWLEKFKATNENMLVVNTSQGLTLQTMEYEHHHGEEDKEENHQEESLDPHIWLSPKLVKNQANNIYETLAKIDPQNGAEYRHNLENFVTDIEKLDQEISQKLAGLKNRKFMVFHPNWAYFAKDYNLEMIPIEVDGKEPSVKELAKIIKEGKEENIKVVFTDPEFSTATAESIAKQINAQVLLINPIAPNWLENMREIADKMYQSLSQNKQVNLEQKYLAKV